MKVKEGERVFETMKRILDMAGKYRRYITMLLYGQLAFINIRSELRVVQLF